MSCTKGCRSLGLQKLWENLPWIFPTGILKLSKNIEEVYEKSGEVIKKLQKK